LKKINFYGTRIIFSKKSLAASVKSSAGLPDGIFSNQNSNLGIFWTVLQWKIMVHFMTIWYILCTFGIHILWPFGIFFPFFFGGGGQRPLVPFLLLGPPFFSDYSFRSTALLTGIFFPFLHVIPRKIWQPRLKVVNGALCHVFQWNSFNSLTNDKSSTPDKGGSLLLRL
jgi:hypothetical protein